MNLLATVAVALKEYRQAYGHETNNRVGATETDTLQTSICPG